MKTILDISNLSGLSEQEAIARLRKEGLNELPSSKPRSIWAIALSVFEEPMLLLLVACGVIYFTLGDAREAMVLLCFVFVIIGISLYQERKTERALEALRDLSSPRALVIRSGVERRIAGRDVARGDLIVLSEGDRVPADAVLLSRNYIEVDESLVTGESVAVQKCPGKEPGDSSGSLFSGTLVVKGKGIAEVYATGPNTMLGKIGKALQTVEQEQTRLHKETGAIVLKLAAGGLCLCGIIVLVYGLTQSHWRDGLLAGITLAMAIMPEEFPVVLAVFLALGAWRMAQKNVLTRRVPAVEALGAATVLCVDKTGTLTQNRMTLRKMFAFGAFYDVPDTASDVLPEPFHEALEYSILASQIDPFDPMEKAFAAAGQRYLENTEHLHSTWTLEQEYPLSQELLAMSHVWRSSDSRRYVIAAKGAPEAIVDLCHLDETHRRQVSATVSLMAREGLRILAVAKAHFDKGSMPDGQHDFDFELVGLMGFADPIRPAVPDAIKHCYAAGIRVIMITGDYPETARNIAHKVGLRPAEECLTGPELDAMEDAQLADRIRTTNLFARVVPEQKLRLVNALKANGEIVAMTGDGVNDAPALKSAHIGVAMGERGTDVAREAADLVLLDDDFSSIVQAVRLGRRIYDNLKKAIAYIMAIHVPIAGMSLIPVLFQWPMVLMPIHIAFLELIIDPACSVVFEAEPEEQDVMGRPPRRQDESLFSRRLVFLSILQGLSVLAIVLAVFAVTWYRGHGDADNRAADARALTFTTLIIANLGLIMTNRSWSRTILGLFKSHNRALWWVLACTILCLGLILFVPFLRGLFHFQALHTVDLAVALAAGVTGVLWFEMLKLFKRSEGTQTIPKP